MRVKWVWRVLEKVIFIFGSTHYHQYLLNVVPNSKAISKTLFWNILQLIKSCRNGTEFLYILYLGSLMSMFYVTMVPWSKRGWWHWYRAISWIISRFCFVFSISPLRGGLWASSICGLVSVIHFGEFWAAVSSIIPLLHSCSLLLEFQLCVWQAAWHCLLAPDALFLCLFAHFYSLYFSWVTLVPHLQLTDLSLSRKRVTPEPIQGILYLCYYIF